MQWSDLITALALLMIIEGMLPFINPKLQRHLLIMMIKRHDRAFRLVGFFSMMVGITLLYIVR